MTTHEQQNSQSHNSETIHLVKLLKNGYRFEFYDGEDKIECWGSSVSGKELVFLNGKQVSSTRNLISRKSLHTFEHDDHKYEVEFNMVSLLKGELHCVVIKDEVHFQTRKAIPSNFTNKKPFSLVRGFIEGFVFGVIGFACGYYITGLFDEDDKASEVIGALLEPAKFFFS